MKLLYADGVQAPLTAPNVLAAKVGRTEVGDLLLGWTVESASWLADPSTRGRTFMAGYALARPIAEGRIVALPVRLSAVPSLITSNPPDVAVVTGVRRGDGYALSTSIGWADVAARVAEDVIVELDPAGTDFGGPLIEGNIVATVDRPAGTGGPPAAQRPADDIDLRIGALVVSLLPDQPTLQFGPGGIGEGIARALDRPVSIWSGLLTDAVASLADRGLLVGPATAAYTWGGAPIDRLAADGMVSLQPVSVTHDLTRLSSIPRFVGCNTAIQVGLDGSVNVERVRGRIISSVGGHADFCAGASRSPGGMSIVALRSMTAGGDSTIVPVVEVVSTARCDVQVVVTEYGIADLRGCGDAERARRIASIAAPAHRNSLLAACG